MRILKASLAAAVLCLAAASAGPARAGPDATSQAKQDFAEGQKAFRAGDFRHAAESFEAAYKAAPHPDALWNAARAWHRADERAKAANLYAKYLRSAPPNARDRNSATEAMKELSGQLSRLEIHAVDLTDVRVDGVPVEELTVFVTPGAHVIEAKAGDRVVRKEQATTAGSVLSIALVAPPPEEKAAPPPPAPVEPTPVESHGISPIFFVIGCGLTAAGAGVTVYSGVDTVNAKNSYEAKPSAAGLETGQSKQTRTNILLGATIGMGALTGVTGLFFTDWGKKSDALKVGIGPGSLSIRQDF